METIPEWVKLLGNYGFPTVVALYLLVRFEKRIDRLTKAIHELILLYKQDR
ncbi:YvrJ family protein [Evansella clarkii]|uniref:YvrJ family protein n=1 Tax=Evansella clarkii TaxID=79879 RepID=UPI000998E5F9|nr:YvrJ family protein [Evansella clarkii]